MYHVIQEDDGLVFICIADDVSAVGTGVLSSGCSALLEAVNLALWPP